MTGQRQSKVLTAASTIKLFPTPENSCSNDSCKHQSEPNGLRKRETKGCKQLPDNTGDDRKSNCACCTTEYHAKVSNGPTSGPALILVSVSGPLSRDFDPRRPQAVLVQRQPKTPEKGFTHNSECSIRNDGGMDGNLTTRCHSGALHVHQNKWSDAMHCFDFFFLNQR